MSTTLLNPKNIAFNLNGQKNLKANSQVSKNEKLMSLYDLFLNELKSIYDAEKQLIAAFPMFSESTTSPELREAFEEHLDITEIQLKRVEEIFSLLNYATEGRKCDAMESLIKENDMLINTIVDPMLRDTALIYSMQKLEHYKIAVYGSLRSFADVLGYNDASDLLQATLDEEGMADKKLTELAEAYVNEEANII